MTALAYAAATVLGFNLGLIAAAVHAASIRHARSMTYSAWTSVVPPAKPGGGES